MTAHGECETSRDDVVFAKHLERKGLAKIFKEEQCKREDKVFFKTLPPFAHPERRMSSYSRGGKLVIAIQIM